jgi:hypothetical protein
VATHDETLEHFAEALKQKGDVVLGGKKAAADAVSSDEKAQETVPTADLPKKSRPEAVKVVEAEKPTDRTTKENTAELAKVIDANKPEERPAKETTIEPGEFAVAHKPKTQTTEEAPVHPLKVAESGKPKGPAVEEATTDAKEAANNGNSWAWTTSVADRIKKTVRPVERSARPPVELSSPPKAAKADRHGDTAPAATKAEPAHQPETKTNKRKSKNGKTLPDIVSQPPSKTLAQRESTKSKSEKRPTESTAAPLATKTDNPPPTTTSDSNIYYLQIPVPKAIIFDSSRRLGFRFTTLGLALSSLLLYYALESLLCWTFCRPNPVINYYGEDWSQTWHGKLWSRYGNSLPYEWGEALPWTADRLSGGYLFRSWKVLVSVVKYVVDVWLSEGGGQGTAGMTGTWSQGQPVASAYGSQKTYKFRDSL